MYKTDERDEEVDAMCFINPNSLISRAKEDHRGEGSLVLPRSFPDDQTFYGPGDCRQDSEAWLRVRHDHLVFVSSWLRVKSDQRGPATWGLGFGHPTWGMGYIGAEGC